MGKFRIITTERKDEAHERSPGEPTGDPDGSARSLGCADSCILIPIDTPGYGTDAKDISPLAEGEADA